MSTYTVAPDAYGSKGLRVIRGLVNIALFITFFAAFVLVLGLVMWLYHRLFGAPITLLVEFKRIVLGMYNDTIGWITFALLFLVTSYSKPQKFKVLVSSDFLMIEGRWSWQSRHLWRSDVEYVREMPGGGLLMWPAGLTIGSKKSEIFIPAGAENYEQIRSELSQWVPGVS
jgi:hypothetical protein